MSNNRQSYHKSSLRREIVLLTIIVIAVVIFSEVGSYVHMRRLSEIWADRMSNALITQISADFESRTNQIATNAVAFSSNEDVQQLLMKHSRQQKYNIYQSYKQTVHTIEYSNPWIYGIWLVGMDGSQISDPNRNSYEIIETIREEYDVWNSDMQAPFYTSVVQVSPQFCYYGYIFPIYSMLRGRIERVGTGIMILDLTEMEKLVQNSVTENSVLCILDQDNTVVVGNEGYKTGDSFNHIFWNGDETFEEIIELDGVNYFARMQQIGSGGWKTVSLIPLREMTEPANRSLVQGVALSLGVILIVVLLNRFMTVSITGAIQNMLSFLEDDGAPNLKSRIRIPKQSDMAAIAVGINMLLDNVEDKTRRIVHQQERLYEEKFVEQEAQLDALQTQINPHFLYNTLNCMSSIGMAYGVPEISTISIAMSEIYRYSIKGPRFVTLSQEMGVVQEYIRIMDIRFPGKFQISMDLEDGTQDLYVLRMMLQPVVENAYSHGLERRSGEGHLWIHAGVAGDTLTLRVRNDGKPISEEKLEEIRRNMEDYEEIGLYQSPHTGIGISNINKRIHLWFGKDYGLFIESSEEFGTVVTMTIPVMDKPPENTDQAVRNLRMDHPGNETGE